MTDGTPLVSAEVDLRDFPFTPIFRSRLFGSSFHARVSDAEWRAGVTLWLKSWDQVPAGSLPDDDVDLCRLAELGRDLKAWRKLRPGALHGWFPCADGRLYHKVVAEGVNEAWQRKQEQRERTEKARAAKLAKRLSQTAEAPVTTSVTDDATVSVTDTATGSKGQGQGQYKEKGSTASPVEYAFVGKVVRLKPSDFETWHKSFRNLDLMAELAARDAWLASEEATDEDRRKWFISTSRLLANRNAEAAAKGLKPKAAHSRPQASTWAKEIDFGDGQ